MYVRLVALGLYEHLPVPFLVMFSSLRGLAASLVKIMCENFHRVLSIISILRNSIWLPLSATLDLLGEVVGPTTKSHS